MTPSDGNQRPDAPGSTGNQVRPSPSGITGAEIRFLPYGLTVIRHPEEPRPYPVILVPSSWLEGWEGTPGLVGFPYSISGMPPLKAFKRRIRRWIVIFFISIFGAFNLLLPAAFLTSLLSPWISRVYFFLRPFLP